MQPRERFLSANGLTHHVLEWGEPSAPPIVLCHGFLDLAWGFAALGPLLAEAGCRAIALDFRGHGESGRVPEGGYYYFPDYVRDLHELAPQLTDGPFHLLGHSMGGSVATLFTATHPGLVRTLALLEGMGPPPEPEERAPARMKSWLEQTASARTQDGARLPDLEAAYERLSRRHPQVSPALLRLLAEKSTCAHESGSGLTWRFDPLHRTRSPIPFDAQRFRYFLQQIDVPTCVVSGERGFRNGEDEARIALLRNARHTVLEGAGHMLHWTHAREVASLLRDLVSPSG